MARVLLVDDDRDQLAIRKLLMEHSGHTVFTADNTATARRLACDIQPDIAVLDLRLPKPEDGLALIRDLRGGSATLKIFVLSGWTEDLIHRPEAKLVDNILAKPVRSQRLLGLLSKLAIAVLIIAPTLLSAAQNFSFQVASKAEVVADLELSGPGSNWATAGHESALATITLDGQTAQHVMLYNGERRRNYSIFLGSLDAGEHRIAIERHSDSAAGTTVAAHAAKFREIHPGDPDADILANMPIVCARQNTIGKFTDIPLLSYAERLRDESRPLIQYTMIFSNEDGGTSTRGLMARWGRTTDIEYMYRVWLNQDGTVWRATMQSSSHEEVEFKGAREGSHPLLIPITDNNIFGDTGMSSIRYQIPPIVATLNDHSREVLMDAHPFTYRVAAEEMTREGKIRPFGIADGTKIADSRNYLYVEANVTNTTSGLVTYVRLKDESRWRSSNFGHEEAAIERSGWVRTTVELPHGTKASQIAEIGFGCIAFREHGRIPLSGSCRLEGVKKAFLLNDGYEPGDSLFHWSGTIDIPAGEMQFFRTDRAN